MTAVVTPAESNQGAFNQRTLKYYDRLLEFTCNWIWRCPVERTLELYRRHLSSNHLEVGVGTGYFLDRGRLPGRAPRLALLDTSPHCLQHTAARLARYAPEAYRADALAPIELAARGFDSIAINYVVHCMGGTLPGKGAAFANLKPSLQFLPRAHSSRCASGVLNPKRRVSPAGDAGLELHADRYRVCRGVGCQKPRGA